jgi:hypothetical protein
MLKRIGQRGYQRGQARIIDGHSARKWVSYDAMVVSS